MSTSRYSGNAIYDYLAQQTPANPYLIAPGQKTWPLIYSNNKGQPAVIVLVCEAIPTAPGKPSTTGANCQFANHLLRLATRANLPFRALSFWCGPSGALQLAWMQAPGQPGSCFQSIDEQHWRAELESLGVETNGSAAKDINRASSSSYHDWQRRQLGTQTRVVDIDLLRLTPQGQVSDLVELKRADMPLDKWWPFPQDLPNYQLLHATAQAMGVGLEIAFNTYKKINKQDDLSRFRVFRFVPDNNSFREDPSLTQAQWFGAASPSQVPAMHHGRDESASRDASRSCPEPNSSTASRSPRPRRWGR